jgi:hypothetical protein
MAKHRKPITSFDELHEEMVAQGLLRGRGVTIRRGSVHEVDRSDTDLLELGSRVAEELN